MNFRELKVTDINSVARLHEKAFKSFLLTNLGFRFLREFYYSIFQSQNSINLGLFVGNNLVGFAIGVQKNRGFYTKILKNNFFKLVFSAFLKLLINPLYIYKLFISFKSSSESNGIENDDAVLLSICVDPTSSSRGYGTLLLSKFEEVAFRFSDTISLTTDATDNDSVNTFYLSNGFKLKKSFFQGKRKMNCYTKQNKK